MSPKRPTPISPLDRFRPAETVKSHAKTHLTPMTDTASRSPEPHHARGSVRHSGRPVKVIHLGGRPHAPSQPSTAQTPAPTQPKTPTQSAPLRAYLAEELLTPAEAAGVLRLSEKTLANWRSKGTGYGPTYRKVGGRVRYMYRDVTGFIEAGVRARIEGGEGE